jgi:hypothetical protein
MAAIQLLHDRGVTVNYLPQRAPPSIEIGTNWSITGNTTSWLLFNTLESGIPSSDGIILTTISSDEGLLPNGSVVVTRATNAYSIYWVLKVTPAPGQTGVGTISLTASNDAGLVTNVTILVTVDMPLPLDNQFFATTNLSWQTAVDAPWFGQTGVSFRGKPAAQSGRIGDGGASWLKAVATGPGILTFCWKVSSETDYDWLEFYVNGVLQASRISGEVDWRQQTIALSSGTQPLGWRYVKDPDTSTGLDAGWLAQVSFVAEDVNIPPVLNVLPFTSNQFSVSVSTVNGRVYYFEYVADLNDPQWTSVASIAGDGTARILTDPTITGSQRFYRVRLE